MLHRVFSLPKPQEVHRSPGRLVMVHRSIAEKFNEKFCAAISALSSGLPFGKNNITPLARSPSHGSRATVMGPKRKKLKQHRFGRGKTGRNTVVLWAFLFDPWPCRGLEGLEGNVKCVKCADASTPLRSTLKAMGFIELFANYWLQKSKTSMGKTSCA